VIGGPGDLVHSLIQKPSPVRSTPNGGGEFKGIDHVAIAVPPGSLDECAEYYRRVLGFEITHQELTATEYSAMRSIVVEDPSHSVKFPLVEPAAGKRESQVAEFLRHHGGPGVQHVALLCEDISTAVGRLRANGLHFLDIPDEYYRMAPSRVGDLGEAFERLRQAKVLIDRDEWGLLIQTFSRPITGRPTLFFELVQRDGARGFGAANIRALFEALELRQAAAVAG
jgi:4-hydroxyphenylpyruvate dioxygenase